ncbi:hypothetical protein CFOL_v3_00433 [Cephalotus follicularis]|uniref:Putative plant transposon protein domain-containing protein n=1 Tax=Cephalotus follicularis TaxID=3775 RepID=A0A1Q3AMV5_CEPFO|nr:hypothetical protein CFOL_v3_00433 [Cephalotus follicularis]
MGQKNKKGTATVDPPTREEIPPVIRYPEAYFNSRILVENTLDFEFCNSEGFPIVGWLEELGLSPLFSTNLPYYPDLLKEFYVNILSSSSVSLSTSVKNKEIKFTYATLGSILGIPCEGARGWNQRNWIINDEFNKEECVRMLFGENADVIQRMYTRKLSLHRKFLHHAVDTHILPKAGGFDEVTHMEAYTMFHIITGQKINVPMLIINHMHNRANARLPYSNIISKILMHYGVDYSGELHHTLQSADKLGKGTLGRMGFKKLKRLETSIPREEDSNRMIEDVEGEELGEEAQGEAANEPQVDPTPNVNLPRNQMEELLEAIKGIQQEVKEINIKVQTIKRRQKILAKHFAQNEMVGDEGLVTSSSSSQDDIGNPREYAATDDLEGDMDDTPMDN